MLPSPWVLTISREIQKEKGWAVLAFPVVTISTQLTREVSIKAGYFLASFS